MGLILFMISLPNAKFSSLLAIPPKNHISLNSGGRRDRAHLGLARRFETTRRLRVADV